MLTYERACTGIALTEKSLKRFRDVCTKGHMSTTTSFSWEQTTCVYWGSTTHFPSHNKSDVKFTVIITFKESQSLEMHLQSRVIGLA